MRKKIISKGKFGLNTSLITTLLGSTNELLGKSVPLGPVGVDINKINAEASKTLGSVNSITDQQKTDFLNKNKNKWDDTKTYAKEFLGKEENQKSLAAINDTVSTLGLAAVGKDPDALDAPVNAIADLAGNFGPWGQAAKYGIKALNFVDKAFGKTTDGFEGNLGVSGYADLSTDGKQFRLSQTKAKNRALTNESINKNMFAMGKGNIDMLKKQQDARLQATNNKGMAIQNQLSGNSNFSSIMAKKGATLEDIRKYIKTRHIEKEVVQNPILKSKVENINISEIEKFKQGGVFMPTGKLHKNLHNIVLTDNNLEEVDISKKGIPVISKSNPGEVLEYAKDGTTPLKIAEGGEITQHAEIEKDEIILNLSLTKKLVELMEKGDDEAMIQAGKILSKEIMENASGNTELIDKEKEDEN